MRPPSSSGGQARHRGGGATRPERAGVRAARAGPPPACVDHAEGARGTPSPGGPPPEDGAAAVARMGRAGGLSMVGAAVAALGGVAVTALITNLLPRSVAGTVFTSTALFLITTALVQLGTEVGVVRAIPTALVQGRGGDVRSVVLVAVAPVLLVSLLAAAAGQVWADELARVIVSDAEAPATADQLRVLALFLPVAACGNVLLATSRGFRTQVPTVVVDNLGRVLLQMTFIAVVLTLGFGAVAVVLAWSLPYAVSLVLIGAWVVVLLRRQRRRDAPAAEGAGPDGTGRRAGRPASARRPLLATFTQFWRFTGPRAIATTSQMALKRADILLVAALRSTAEAALYAAATRFVVVGQIGVQALQQALSPQLAAMFARNDLKGVAQVYRATTAWSMLLAWPLYLVCAVFAPQLLRLFGSQYTQAAPIVVILCLTMLAATACGAVDSVLLMSGRTWLSLANNVGALVLNLALNLVLIPSYGALGAAVAWAVAILVRNALPLVQTRLMFGVSPVSRASAVVATTALVCFGALPLVVLIAGADVVWAVAAVVIGGMLYTAVVVAARRLLHLDALAQALRAARPRGRAVDVAAGT